MDRNSWSVSPLSNWSSCIKGNQNPPSKVNFPWVRPDCLTLTHSLFINIFQPPLSRKRWFFLRVSAYSRLDCTFVIMTTINRFCSCSRVSILKMECSSKGYPNEKKWICWDRAFSQHKKSCDKLNISNITRNGRRKELF